MSLIRALDKQFYDYKEKFIDKRNIYKETISELKIEYDELYDKILQMESNYENNKKLFDDVYEFMDFIGINRDELKFTCKEIDNSDINKKESQIIELEEKLDDAIINFNMMNTYIKIIDKINKNDINVSELRYKNPKNISTYETMIDIAILNNISRKKLKEKPLYNAYDQSGYIDAINLYSLENVASLRNINEESLYEDTKLELLLAICRVAWMSEYMDEIANIFVRYGQNNDKKKIKLSEKYLKNLKLSHMVKNDISKINLYKYNNQEIYEKYRMYISKDREKEMKKFKF